MSSVGLGPNVTLDATVNPDFGQVEADPAEVNFSAFETFFTERRPFFLEGSQSARSRRVTAIHSAATKTPNTSTHAASARVRSDCCKRRFRRLSLDEHHPRRRQAHRPPGRTARRSACSAPLRTEEFARNVRRCQSGSFGRGRIAPQTTYGARPRSTGVRCGGVHRRIHDDDDAPPTSPSEDPLAGRRGAKCLHVRAGSRSLRFKEGEYEIGFNLGSAMSAATHSAHRLRFNDRVRATSSGPMPRYRPISTPRRLRLTGFKGGISAERTAGRHWLWQVGAAASRRSSRSTTLGRLSTADDNLRIGRARIPRDPAWPRCFGTTAVSLEHEREWNFGRQGLGNLARDRSRGDLA